MEPSRTAQHPLNNRVSLQDRQGPPGKNRHGRKSGGGPRVRRENPLAGGIYTAPMDHSYRALQGNNNGNARRPGRGGAGQGMGKQFMPPDVEPLPASADASPARIFAFVDDLFFLAKIQETARKMNVKVEFVKTDKELQEKMGLNGADKPSLIIFDLNNVGAKPLTLIPKLKAKLKKTRQHHRLRFARAGRFEDEGAGSRLRHGGATFRVLAEPGAVASPSRRAG